MTISPSQIAELRELVELEHTMSISHTQSSDYRKAEVALRIGVREKLPTLLDTLDSAWKVIEAAHCGGTAMTLSSIQNLGGG